MRVAALALAFRAAGAVAIGLLLLRDCASLPANRNPIVCCYLSAPFAAAAGKLGNGTRFLL